MNPFLERQAKRSIGTAGRSSEKRVAKSLGANLTPASGAMRGAKGDCKTEDFLMECKSTVLQSIALQMGWLVKISSEAITQNKTPAVVISFVDALGKPAMILNSEWVLLPKSKFQELIED